MENLDSARENVRRYTMYTPIRSYSCGSMSAQQSTKECCKMRKMTYIAGERGDNVSLIYSTVRSVLERRFTSVKDDGVAALLRQNNSAIKDLLGAVDVKMLQRLIDLRDTGI